MQPIPAPTSGPAAAPQSQIPDPKPQVVFDPPPHRIPQVLDHLDSPFASLQNVAAANNTTIEALALWMQRPEITERNALIDAAAAQRTRSLATRNLRRAVAALSQVLERATEEDANPAFSSHPKAHLARTQNRDLICRATRLLMQITTSLPAAGRSAIRRGGAGVELAEKPEAPPARTAPTRPRAPIFRTPAAPFSLHDLRARAGAAPTRNGQNARTRATVPTHGARDGP